MIKILHQKFKGIVRLSNIRDTLIPPVTVKGQRSTRPNPKKNPSVSRFVRRRVTGRWFTILSRQTLSMETDSCNSTRISNYASN